MDTHKSEPAKAAALKAAALRLNLRRNPNEQQIPRPSGLGMTARISAAPFGASCLRYAQNDNVD